MRLNKEITLAQKIVNNANYKNDFTIEISEDDSVNGRYIVSCYNIYTGNNPSLDFELLTKISDTIKFTEMFDSCGGWLEPYSGKYYLDCNMHFDNLDFALKFAKVNNQTAIFDKTENTVIYLNSKK